VSALLDHTRASLIALTARKHSSRPMESRASITIIFPSYLGYKPCWRILYMQRRCAIEQITCMSLGLPRIDGSHYRSLLRTIVPGSEDNPFFYFSDKHDIALGLSMDGFAPFKRRDKTCWPLILFNYNLHPEICFPKQYCIHVATVPGPKKPWD